MIEKNKLYAFYGSLRKGMDNYNLYSHSLNFISQTSISGYKMFSLTYYPYGVWTNDLNDKIVVDLFKISDAETEEMIHGMEIDAGYILQHVMIAKQKFGIYVFQNFNPQDKQVLSGDWLKYKQTLCF